MRYIRAQARTVNSSRRMSCAAAAVVRACPRGEAFSGRLGSFTSFLLAQNCKTSRALVNPPHTHAGAAAGHPTALHRVHKRQTVPLSASACTSGSPRRAAPTPLPAPSHPKTMLFFFCLLLPFLPLSPPLSPLGGLTARPIGLKRLPSVTSSSSSLRLSSSLPLSLAATVLSLPAPLLPPRA